MMTIDEHSLKCNYIIMLGTYIITCICNLAITLAACKYPKCENAVAVVILEALAFIVIPDFKDTIKLMSEQSTFVSQYLRFLCVMNLVLSVVTLVVILIVLMPIYVSETYKYNYQVGILLSCVLTMALCGITRWIQKAMDPSR